MNEWPVRIAYLCWFAYVHQFSFRFTFPAYR
jgi:hypothetical protein